jgi:molybdopterin/thiamine biosynthesis adenylyltransferase
MNYNAHNFRQLEFIPPELLERPVYLIGAGGIGSPAAMVLSKMGFGDLTTYDMDEVEAHNVGSQLYHEDQEGMPKVAALARFVPEGAMVQAKFPTEGLTLKPMAIVISGVDSMTARQEIWDYLKTQKLVSLYIDARMGLEIIRVYAIDPSDAEEVKFYEANLHPDDESEQLACSAKSVAYNGFYAASVVGGLVSAFLRKAERPREVIGDMAEFRLAPTL